MNVDLTDYDAAKIGDAVDMLNGLCVQLQYLRPETREAVLLSNYPEEWQKFALLAHSLDSLFSEQPGELVPNDSNVVSSSVRKDRIRLPGDSEYREIDTTEMDWYIWKGKSTHGEEYLKRVHSNGDHYWWIAPIEDWSQSVEIDDYRWEKK